MRITHEEGRIGQGEKLTHDEVELRSQAVLQQARKLGWLSELSQI